MYYKIENRYYSLNVLSKQSLILTKHKSDYFYFEFFYLSRCLLSDQMNKNYIFIIYLH